MKIKPGFGFVFIYIYIYVESHMVYIHMTAMADPGFSPGGGANSQSGCANLFFRSQTA